MYYNSDQKADFVSLVNRIYVRYYDNANSENMYISIFVV